MTERGAQLRDFLSPSGSLQSLENKGLAFADLPESHAVVEGAAYDTAALDSYVAHAAEAAVVVAEAAEPAYYASAARNWLEAVEWLAGSA